MNAIFVNPPCKSDNPLPTLGIAYLAAVLKQNDHNAILIDLWIDPVTDEYLKSKISDFSPDIIGVPFFTRRYADTKILLDKLKGWFPDVKIVVGGSHASALPKEVLEEITTVDIVVVGEGEKTIVQLIENLDKDNLEDIKGIAFRRESRIIVTEQPEFIEDLDKLPYPDLLQVDPRKCKIHPPYGWYGLPLTMMTTRGCPGKCVFCSKSVFKNSLRSQSPGRIVDEIEYWKTKLPIKEIRFFDDDFTITRKRSFQICDEMIKRNVNLPWTCTTRVDYLSKELLIKMKEAGLYFIVLGVESGSPRVLKNLRKGYTVSHIRNAFKWCRELGITTFGFFMVGGPGEEDEDRRMTLRIQKEIRPDFLSWGALRVFPGSPLFDECKDDPRYNFLKDKNNPYFELYRKDIEEKFLHSFCQKAMLKHYLSFHGFKSVLTYMYKTRSFGFIKDFLQWITAKL
jgi:Fe-S oxidoreductase